MRNGVNPNLEAASCKKICAGTWPRATQDSLPWSLKRAWRSATLLSRNQLVQVPSRRARIRVPASYPRILRVDVCAFTLVFKAEPAPDLGACGGGPGKHQSPGFKRRRRTPITGYVPTDIYSPSDQSKGLRRVFGMNETRLELETAQDLYEMRLDRAARILSEVSEIRCSRIWG